MKKAKRVLLSLLMGAIFLFPFLFGSYFSAKYFANYAYYKKAIIIVLPIFIFLIFIPKIKIRYSTTNIISHLLFFALFTISIRVFALFIFNTQPTSDFDAAITNAKIFQIGPHSNINSARYPYWGFYSIVLSKVFLVFGSRLSVVKEFNILLSGLTVIGIYFLGNKIRLKSNLGIISSFIYAIWPADIIYKNLSTGEHIFIMLFPFFCLLFFIAFKKIKEKRIIISIILITISGIVLGLMDLFKPVAIVLLIATTITMLLFCKKIHFHSKSIIKSMVFYTTFLLLLYISYNSTKFVGYSIIEKMALNPVNNSGYATTLRVGLDFEKDGRYNRKIAEYYKELLEIHDEDYETVNSILLEETSINIQKNLSKYLGLFSRKFDYMWSSDTQIYFFATVDQVNDQIIIDFDYLGQIIKPIQDFYFLIILSLSSISSAFYGFNRRKQYKMILLYLFILGFALILLLTENQQRYRIVSVPALSIIAAYGIFVINKYLIKMKIILRDIKTRWKEKKTNEENHNCCSRIL